MDLKIRAGVRIAITVMCVIIAICVAGGIGNILAGKIIKVTPYEIGQPSASESKQGQALQDDNADILVYNRNLFNQKGGATEEEEESTEEEEKHEEEELPNMDEVIGDGSRPVLTDLRVMLKGTQVASISAYSVAMFMPLDGGNDARMAYLGEGDTLMEEAKILKIVRNRVYLSRTTQGDRLEYIDTRTTEEDLNEAKKAFEKQAEKEKQAETAREKAAAAAAAAAEKKSAEAAGAAEIVRKVGADTYEVSKEAVDLIRANPKSLQNNPQYGAMPKVQPVYKGGNIGGFRLLGVETNSIYSQLGLKTGDTIIDVNGQQIDGPQKAMSLVDALKPGQDVNIKINRSGQEKTLTFQLK